MAALLAMGIVGCFKLQAVTPEVAYIFFCYPICVTIQHIPFNMNT